MFARAVEEPGDEQDERRVLLSRQRALPHLRNQDAKQSGVEAEVRGSLAALEAGQRPDREEAARHLVARQCVDGPDKMADEILAFDVAQFSHA